MVEIEIIEMVNTLAKMSEQGFQKFFEYVRGVSNPDEKRFLEELVRVALVQRRKQAAACQM